VDGGLTRAVNRIGQFVQATIEFVGRVQRSETRH
jgi:hypothetical protein